MSTGNNERPCNKGCGVLIHWDERIVSKSGKKIPLEHDGEPHQCPKSGYNQERSSGNVEYSTILAKMDAKLDRLLEAITGQKTLGDNG